MCDIRNIFFKVSFRNIKDYLTLPPMKHLKNKINHNYNDTHEVLGTEQGLYMAP
jgi:hypothetical protein